MKNITRFILFSIINTSCVTALYAQEVDKDSEDTQAIFNLIDKYAEARAKKDLLLLEAVFSIDVDQLTSSGEWRAGKQNSIDGVMRSSAARPGARTINIEKIRFLNSGSAIADARYEIKNEDGTSRNMWSTFIVVNDSSNWRLSGIRNMLPAE
jgi:uncharacterized protein (TIGR02246 family)